MAQQETRTRYQRPPLLQPLDPIAAQRSDLIAAPMGDIPPAVAPTPAMPTYDPRGMDFVPPADRQVPAARDQIPNSPPQDQGLRDYLNRSIVMKPDMPGDRSERDRLSDMRYRQIRVNRRKNPRPPQSQLRNVGEAVAQEMATTPLLPPKTAGG